jgi:phage terminase small subunit
MPKLTRRQQIFIKEYRIDGNATRSAVAAGYSAKNAESIGCKLSRNAKVRAEIDKQVAKLDQKLELNNEWVLSRLMKRADYDPRRFWNEDGSLKQITDLGDDQAMALQGFEVEDNFEHFGGGQATKIGVIKKIKMCDRDKALELLGRHLKLFTDKVEVSGLDTLADEIRAARLRAEQ